MDYFVLATIFILGLMVGSFLNVVIFRLNTEEKIVNSRSKCLFCSHKLAWYDLFPVASFLALRGKCRYCKEKLSVQYPLVEIAAAVLITMLLISVFGGGDFSTLNIVRFLLGVYLFSALVVIFVFDIKHYIIPDEVVFPAIGIAAILVLIGASPLVGGWDKSMLLDAVGGAILTAGFFQFLVTITEGKGMGGGDVKLGLLLGIILGIEKSILMLFISFVSGAVIGVLLIGLRRKKMSSAIPFAPFLILAFFVSYFYGSEIIGWYFRTFLEIQM